MRVTSAPTIPATSHGPSRRCRGRRSGHRWTRPSTSSSPKADLLTSDGSWVKITATSGVEDRNQQILDLAGKVDVRQQGYEVHSTQARFVVKDRIATGNAPVWGKGNFGTIAAAGFSVTENGTVVDFTGPVTLVLNNNHDKGAADNAPANAQGPAAPSGEHHPQGQADFW